MPIKLVPLVLTLLTFATPVVVGLLNTGQAASTSSTTEAITQPNISTLPDNSAQIIVSPGEDTSSATTISALGTVEANEVAAVSFLVAGDVAEITVEVGDTVSEGDLLAWLDAAGTQTSYDQARLNLERAQINLDQLYEAPNESTLRVADANIASAQAAYSAAANTSSSSDLEAAQLRYQQALNTYDAQVTARANMNGSDAEITLQDAAVGAASFNLEIARLQLEELQNPDTSNLGSAGVRIKQAQLQKEELLAEPTQAEIDSAEIAIQRVEQQVAEAETALRRTRLYAPISGTVTAVNIEAGDSVGTSTIVIEISDLSQLWLTASVHEVDVAQLSAGQLASVTLDSLPDVEIPATVDLISWLSTIEDDIVYYDTRFALNVADARIRVGMTAQAIVEVEN